MSSNNRTEDWRLWCRLCAKEDPEGNTSIFLKDEHQQRPMTSLEVAIERYFWVNIRRDDNLPSMLCTECFSYVTSLASFSERVSKVQQMFEDLQSSSGISKTDLYAMRLKYGILCDDSHHLPPNQCMTEGHYFEVKPDINELEERLFDAVADIVDANPLEQPRMSTENTTDGECSENAESPIEPRAVCVDSEIEADDGTDEDDKDADYRPPQYYNLPEIDTNTSSNDGAQEGEEHRATRSLRKRKHYTAVKTKPVGDVAVSGLQCPQCPRVLPTLHRLTKHVKTHVPLALRQVIPCTHCDEKFSTSTILRNHIKSTHPTECSFICEQCGAASETKALLKQHILTTHADKFEKLNCTQCSRVFKTRRKLDRHMLAHETLDFRKVVPCPHCDKRFVTDASVKTHIRQVHLNQRPYKCDQCDVSCKARALLKEHMTVHTDAAPFECDVCKKRFKCKSTLRRHTQGHDANKHVCPECGLQLKTRATFKSHLLVHSDDAQHKCEYCGRVFKRAKALKTHLIAHTGLKPFSCNFCDRTFTNGQNCRFHQSKIHAKELVAWEAAGGGRPYKRSMPTLNELKAIVKTAQNLAPADARRSRDFTLGGMPKQGTKDNN